MGSERVPAERCGRTIEYADPGLPGDVTCWRETWRGYDQCIWHAPVEDKPADEIGEARTGHPERLDGAVLRDVDLDDRVSFADCVLVEADLTGADVFEPDRADGLTWGPQSRTASFRGADLSRADLFDADITPADLRGATLAGADVRNATLRRTDLGGADLTGADFGLAVLRDAYLRGVEVEETTFLDTDLSGVDLAGTDLTTADFRGVDLTDTNLRRADLGDADLFGADLGGADLRYADLAGAKLQGCSMDGANARNSCLDGAHLESAVLNRTDLRGASLRNAFLYQVQFSDARIDDRTAFEETCIYESDDVSPTIDADTRADANEIAPLNAATWVYRRLEALHEENALAQRAREYHVRKEEAQRKYYWNRWADVDDAGRTGGIVGKWNLWRALVYEVNRRTSRHGESPYRVVRSSVLTVAFSAVLYPFAGIKPEGGQPITWAGALEPGSGAAETTVDLLAVFAESIYFSTITFTTLGYGDVRPLGWAKALATVESFVGALFLALLVFVLGRQVAW